MKKNIVKHAWLIGALVALILISQFFCGCKITDAAGITHQVSTGPTRELTPEAEAFVESGLSAAESTGGLVGLLGVTGGAIWGAYKARKAKNSAAIAQSLIAGAGEIVNRVGTAQKAGENPVAISKKDVLGALKKAQEDAGTRDAVRAIISKNKIG